jgi:Secretion system C-terminal sorting domain
MQHKIDKTKLTAYLQQAGALSKNIKPAKVAAYGALGVGMLTLPVVPTLGQCGTAVFNAPYAISMDGGGYDFSFYLFGVGVYMSRDVGWQALVNGNYLNGYPYLKNANGINLTTASPWSSGGPGNPNYILYRNGPNDDFEVGTSGFVGVRTNPGMVYGFFQVTIGGIYNFTIDVAQSGMDATPATPAVGGDCSSLTIPLPVELKGFFAKLRHDIIELSWATATESNNAGFEVQRSLDGKDFSKIGWIDGHGDSFTEHKYSLLDENIKPNTDYYYRLRQTDFDGQSEYSPVLVITSLGEGTIISDAYPNPSKDGEINFPFVSANEAEWTATVFNAQGVQLRQQRQMVTKGEFTMALSLGDLPKGNYFVKLENGIEQVYRKVNLF